MRFGDTLRYRSFRVVLFFFLTLWARAGLDFCHHQQLISYWVCENSIKQKWRSTFFSCGGWGVCCQTFSFFFFPCSADHERDSPPCKVGFSCWFFRVGNQNAECEKQLCIYSLCNTSSILLLLDVWWCTTLFLFCFTVFLVPLHGD